MGQHSVHSCSLVDGRSVHGCDANIKLPYTNANPPINRDGRALRDASIPTETPSQVPVNNVSVLYRNFGCIVKEGGGRATRNRNYNQKATRKKNNDPDNTAENLMSTATGPHGLVHLRYNGCTTRRYNARSKSISGNDDRIHEELHIAVLHLVVADATMDIPSTCHLRHLIRSAR